MVAIVNVDKNWGIGYKNNLLCTFPEDMKRFRTFTKNKCIVYGRNTLMSFPGNNPLPNRTNIVISSSKNNIPESSKYLGCDYYAYITKKKFHSKDIAITGVTFNNREAPIDNRKLRTSLILINDINIAEEVGMFLGHCSDDIIVCGGASIYKQMIPMCTEVYVTKNDFHEEGIIPDVYFPNLDEMDDWYIDDREGHSISESGIGYEFLLYRKKRKI